MKGIRMGAISIQLGAISVLLGCIVFILLRMYNERKDD